MGGIRDGILVSRLPRGLMKFADSWVRIRLPRGEWFYDPARPVGPASLPSPGVGEHWVPQFLPCHPERSICVARRSRYAVEGPCAADILNSRRKAFFRCSLIKRIPRWAAG